MTTQHTEDSFAKGTITINSEAGPIEIPYREHASRNGKLLAHLDNAPPLNSDQLEELRRELAHHEQRIAKGRAWYASMAAQEQMFQQMLEARQRRKDTTE
ncbi:hypothetical protein [Sulfuriroseicoccus oceanibius]|uniref:Uncharacterized protein n=1 Tax=Sulfuriroseicoccus oceanibius TaxID=2707525 RepID=A0A6B3L8I6_9BACT|nr:hypothetical protein [Sulfuriroseicoccus oceanibius]QQL43754.1 hypothetical protein G3M56_007525 [Sulfuriroseicoccus oceanibius]